MGTGVVTESASDSSGYADNSTSTMASDGSWQPATGGGWTSSSGFTLWGFSASGTYGYAVAGGAVSGTWQQSGSANTSYNTATNYTQSGSDAPSYTGTASTGDGGGQSDSYQGSGAYAVNSSGSASGSGGGSGSGSTVAPATSPIPGASGGPDASGATFTGIGAVTESAGDSSGYSDASTSLMASDGSWQPASASGWTSSSGFTQWGYVAAGLYGYAIAGGAVAGTWRQSGSANTSYNTATNYTQSGSGTPVYSGSQADAQSGGQIAAYSGSGSYAVASGSSGYPGPDGATLAGNGLVAESGSDNWGYGYATQDAMSGDGTWLAGDRLRLDHGDRRHRLGLLRLRDLRPALRRRRDPARDVAGVGRLGHELRRAVAVHAQRRRLLDHHRHGREQRQRLGRLVLFGVRQLRAVLQHGQRRRRFLVVVQQPSERDVFAGLVVAVSGTVHAGGRRGRGHGDHRLGLRERLGEPRLHVQRVVVVLVADGQLRLGQRHDHPVGRLVGPVADGVAAIAVAGRLHDHVVAGPGDDHDGRRLGQ